MDEILTQYPPITLEEMSGIRLMNRTDTKFVTNTAMLIRLLQLAKDDYYVQTIDGKRVANYYTLYFDTTDCEMFRIHHNGHLNRQKLRVRSYVDSGLSFLEVKTKNNHGRTHKKRMAFAAFDPLNPQYELPSGSDDTAGCHAFVDTHLRYGYDAMESQVENNFSRVTLVNKQKTERLTIDSNLKFHNLTTGNEVDLSGLAIIELKRDGLVASPVLEMLRSLRIKPMGFSKYCISQALTNPGLRHNRLKMRLHALERLLDNN